LIFGSCPRLTYTLVHFLNLPRTGLGGPIAQARHDISRDNHLAIGERDRLLAINIGWHVVSEAVTFAPYETGYPSPAALIDGCLRDYLLSEGRKSLLSVYLNEILDSPLRLRVIAHNSRDSPHNDGVLLGLGLGLGLGLNGATIGVATGIQDAAVIISPHKSSLGETRTTIGVIGVAHFRSGGTRTASAPVPTVGRPTKADGVGCDAKQITFSFARSPPIGRII
jgi:hypothetical protein